MEKNARIEKNDSVSCRKPWANITRYRDTYLDERRAQNLVMTIHLEDEECKKPSPKDGDGVKVEISH
jgi:hypothetical protein